MRADLFQATADSEAIDLPGAAQRDPPPAIHPCGDAALTVEFAPRVDAGINARVLGLDAALTAAGLTGVNETAPSYGSVLVYYDPLATTFELLRHRILQLCLTAPDITDTGAGWVIPVAYGGNHGFDLAAVAHHHGMAADEIVERHTSARYRVFMVGFLPGFTYLGGLDPDLAIPRRPVPRVTVPAGSIVIGGVQTAIGSIVGPSGWHVVGSTPVRPFMPRRDPVIFIKPGDTIVFEAISAAEHRDLSASAADGALVARSIA